MGAVPSRFSGFVPVKNLPGAGDCKKNQHRSEETTKIKMQPAQSSHERKSCFILTPAPQSEKKACGQGPKQNADGVIGFLRLSIQAERLDRRRINRARYR
jgi:hypothetical protein